MSAELSYVQLKVANEARESVSKFFHVPRSSVIFFLQDEVKCEQRRKNLLVLIHHYLQEEGYASHSHTLNL